MYCVTLGGMLYSPPITPRIAPMSATDPADLTQVLSQMEALVRRAYADGYRAGAQDSADRMMRAVSNNIEQRVGVIDPAAIDRMPLPHRAGVRGRRMNVYGTVTATFRQAILAAPDAGLTKDDLMAYCSRLGMEITVNTYRDTMKRLIGGEEVQRRHGAYFPGPKLRRDLAEGSPSPPPGKNKVELKTVDVSLFQDD